MSTNENPKWSLKKIFTVLKKVFTILFLLSVILVAMGALLPLFLPHRCAGGGKNACIANLKQLQAATDIWAQEQQKTTKQTPTFRDLVGTNAYIRDQPACPSGGSYALGRVGKPPRCSVPGHTL